MDRDSLISEVCGLEWAMFVQVNNRGGKASCQNDEAFFRKMRVCQFSGWSDRMLLCYRDDLKGAEEEGRNLPMEKYAWMMESTHPAEFAGIRPSLPTVSPEKAKLIAELVRIQVDWEVEVDKAYPYMRASGRPLRKSQDTPWATSFETYLEGELKTYSEATLEAYLEHVRQLQSEDRNFALIVAENTARAYGFATLEAAEEHARHKAAQRGE